MTLTHNLDDFMMIIDIIVKIIDSLPPYFYFLTTPMERRSIDFSLLDKISQL